MEVRGQPCGVASLLLCRFWVSTLGIKLMARMRVVPLRGTPPTKMSGMALPNRYSTWSVPSITRETGFAWQAPLLAEPYCQPCLCLKITCHIYDYHGQLKLEKIKHQILVLMLKVPEDGSFLWVPGLLSAAPRSPRTVCAFQHRLRGRRDPIPNSFPITQKDAEAQRGTDTCLR